MSLQSNFKKPSFIALLVLGILVGTGLPLLAYSPMGRELYADIWLFAIMPFFILGLSVFSLVITWKKISKKRRMVLILNTIAVALLAYVSLSFNWQHLPWGRMSAIETANGFMSDLSNADYASAYERLSPVTQEHLTPESLDQPDAQPVSWQLGTIDRDSIVTGTAIFPDGVELPVEIQMVWLDHNWKINGVEFGEWKEDANGNFERTTRMSFLFCCDDSGFIIDTILSLIDRNR